MARVLVDQHARKLANLRVARAFGGQTGQLDLERVANEHVRHDVGVGHTAIHFRVDGVESGCVDHRALGDGRHVSVLGDPDTAAGYLAIRLRGRERARQHHRSRPEHQQRSASDVPHSSSFSIVVLRCLRRRTCPYSMASRRKTYASPRYTGREFMAAR
jgi:hypothetical protein